KLPMKIAKRVFLCEGKIDDGGYLRVVTLDEKGFECIEIKNQIYKKK
ncbi:serine/threonine protein phosphatase, partial [Campylobacter jejuni]|nr:serine/threonine protein phosphatase [Campylobacter jejuni]